MFSLLTIKFWYCWTWTSKFHCSYGLWVQTKLAEKETTSKRGVCVCVRKRARERDSEREEREGGKSSKHITAQEKIDFVLQYIQRENKPTVILPWKFVCVLRWSGILITQVRAFLSY